MNPYEERIGNDLKIIVERIVSSLSEKPRAILLCGGYGRGEGAWIDTERGPIPYNDYDLTVVSNSRLDRDTYRYIRTELAKQIGIRWIDIDFVSEKELKVLKPTIGNIDLINASKIVYGDQNVLSICPPIKASNIGFFDVEKLYKTRLWTFLGSFYGGFRDLNIEESLFFKNQMAKAALAACDVILIKNKSYVCSYKERVKVVKDYCPEKWERLFDWALAEKTRPTCVEINKSEMENLFWNVRELFCWSMKYAMGKKWKFFGKPKKTKQYYYLNTSFFAHDLYNRVFRRSKLVRKCLDVFLAQNYAFWANDHGVVNSHYLRKGLYLLKKWKYIDDIDSADWYTLRERSAYARNNT